MILARPFYSNALLWKTKLTLVKTQRQNEIVKNDLHLGIRK